MCIYYAYTCVSVCIIICVCAFTRLDNSMLILRCIIHANELIMHAYGIRVI